MKESVSSGIQVISGLKFDGYIEECLRANTDGSPDDQDFVVVTIENSGLLSSLRVDLTLLKQQL